MFCPLIKEECKSDCAFRETFSTKEMPCCMLVHGLQYLIYNQKQEYKRNQLEQAQNDCLGWDYNWGGVV